MTAVLAALGNLTSIILPHVSVLVRQKCLRGDDERARAFLTEECVFLLRLSPGEGKIKG